MGASRVFSPSQACADIYQLYFQSYSKPPIYWKTPTVGSFLQGLSGVHTFWMRSLPSVIVGIAFAGLFLSRRLSGELFELYPLTALSLLTSPYGWTYDHILLLPVGLWILSCAGHGGEGSFGSKQWIPKLLILGNVILMIPIGSLELQNYVWYPAWFLFLTCLSSQDRRRVICDP